MIWRAVLILLALAGPAHAGPVAALIGLLSGAAGFTGAVTLGAFWTSVGGRLLVTVALSALSRALAPKVRDPGLQTRVTQAGGTNPASFILGRYATGGFAVAPPMSHGSNNDQLTLVIDVSDVPVAGLGRLIIDGEYAEIGGPADGDGFLPIGGRFVGRASVKFRDGTQTTADPWLLATYGSYPERPWTSDMIGRGVAYAILRFGFNREVFQGIPQVRFEVQGVRLYDPRFDTTVGGDGAQRSNDSATWAFTENPAVMVYNALRGITLADGSVWGGSVAAADLPLSVWMAAMTECDVLMDVPSEGTVSRTNLALWSEQIDNAFWGKSRVTVGVDAAVAPDGATTAERLTETAQTGVHNAARSFAYTSGTQYTWSVHVKAESRTRCLLSLPAAAFGSNQQVRFDLVDATATSISGSPAPSIEALAGGWYRVSITATATATASGNAEVRMVSGTASSYAGDGVSSLLVWGAQFETGGLTGYTRSTDTPGVQWMEPQFRAAFEVTVNDEPMAVIEELLKGCSGAVAEVGGVWKIRVGPPALPVYTFSDLDVLVSRPQDYDPFPSPEELFNGVSASYPEPESLWEAKDAPPRYDADAEAEDGGRRLVADLSLPAVPFANQVQRIMRSVGLDHRRVRRHAISLPPEAAILEPLDTIAWSSDRNGYVAKLFELGQVADEAMTLVQAVAMREVDSTDYDWVQGFSLPSAPAPAVVVIPAAAAVPGFAVTAVAITDGSNNRRPALRLSWTAASMAGARGITWELRRTGGAVELRGDVQDVAAGEVTLGEGILPETAYEARMKPLSDAPSDWSAWLGATSLDLRVDTIDIAANAATRDVRSYADGIVTLSSDTTWSVVGSVTITRSGVPTDLTASLSLDGADSGVLQLGVFRGSTNIAMANDSTGLGGRQTQVCLNVVDFDTGTGATTYELRARKTDPALTGGWDADIRVFRRFFSAVQLKR